MKRFKGELILLTASILWGTCFVFQKEGMSYIEPYTLGSFRFLIGGMLLIPIMPFSKKIQTDSSITITHNFRDNKLWLGGILCGISLFWAASLQQIGLKYTTAGKAGFLTSMEIVLVAAISLLVVRKLRLHIIFGILMAVLGMYFLCMFGSNFKMQLGDQYECAAVVFWAAQILLVDFFSKRTDIIRLSFLQFMTTGFLSLIAMLLFEKVNLSQIIAGIIPILYTAIIEVAVAYTLQVIGQMYTSPVVASVILSLESVFSAISGAILLQERLTILQLFGCILMVAAVITTQLPEKNKEEPVNG